MYSTDTNQVSAFDAKTHLSQLLFRVQEGNRITITKHNTPVAMLIPVEIEKQPATEVIEKMLNMRKRHTLGGLSIKELQEEGRL